VSDEVMEKLGNVSSPVSEKYYKCTRLFLQMNVNLDPKPQRQVKILGYWT